MKKTALKTPSERFLAETARFELACRCRQTDFESSPVMTTSIRLRIC